MSDELFRWGDPPPDKRRNTPTAEFVEALKQRPGQWAQYRPGHPHSSGTPQWLRRQHGVQVTTRSRGDDRLDVWARWNPKEET